MLVSRIRKASESKKFSNSKDNQKASPLSGYKMESLEACPTARDKTGCIKHAYATGETATNYIRAGKSLKI